MVHAVFNAQMGLQGKKFGRAVFLDCPEWVYRGKNLLCKKFGWSTFLFWVVILDH
jgi:hypothetical protein